MKCLCYSTYSSILQGGNFVYNTKDLCDTMIKYDILSYLMWTVKLSGVLVADVAGNRKKRICWRVDSC